MVNFVQYGRKTPNSIDVTSRSAEDWSRQLSPFLLGPCSDPVGRVSKNFENLWQYSKVYPEHLDEDMTPKLSWRWWQKMGFAKERADRYPMGKGAKPCFSFWGTEMLSYVDARKKIYAPIYYSLIQNHPSFLKLKEMSLTQDIEIADFDVYPMSGISYSDVINNPAKKCGHGFIIGMALENQLAWLE